MAVYASAAERQRAYRERYRRRIEQRIETHEARLEQLQQSVDELQHLLGQLGMAAEREEVRREAA